jgi:uncharacterized protein (DUF3820 family)
VKQLTDSDPFPFGVHKGKPMEKVPGKYLDWVQDQPFLKDRFPEVLAYIEKNRASIDWEIDHEK